MQLHITAHAPTLLIVAACGPIRIRTESYYAKQRFSAKQRYFSVGSTFFETFVGAHVDPTPKSMFHLVLLGPCAAGHGRPYGRP